MTWLRSTNGDAAEGSVIPRACQTRPRGHSRDLVLPDHRAHPETTNAPQARGAFGGWRRARWNSAGDAGRATSGELVLRVRGLRVELDEARLDLAEHLAHRDAEHALAAAHEVDDLVVRGAEVDAGAVAHQGRLGEVADAGLAELVHRGADLLQRDAGVEQALD